MNSENYDIEIISAPSILGLKPTGVEELSKSFLDASLANKLGVASPIVHVPTLNHTYSNQRHPETNVLNANSIREFSITLNNTIITSIGNNRFPIVLGGDCSILIGIMPALKQSGNYGLIFIDAHADFYSTDKSVTGEAADMDLAIVTGHGPDLLTNINGLNPYLKEQNVIHIGQRDLEETKKYGSPDIRDTAIKCFSLSEIEQTGTTIITNKVLREIENIPVDKFWIHFDTDVLNDDINPAVDYRLPGGLYYEQAEYFLMNFLATGKIAGMSVTIFNPKLDINKTIVNAITDCIAGAFK